MDMMTNWEIAENHEWTKDAIAKTNELLNKYTVEREAQVQEIRKFGARAAGSCTFQVTVVTIVQAGLKENAGLIGMMRKKGYKAIRCQLGDGYGYRISKQISFITKDPEQN